MANTPAEVQAIFESLTGRFRPDEARGYTGVFHWTIEGAALPHWTVAIDNGTCHVEPELRGDPVCAVRMTKDVFLAIETGRRNPTMAFVKGKISATNVGALRQYDRIFFRFHDVDE